MVQYSPSLRKMPVRAERRSRFATDGCGWALGVLVSMRTRRVPSATQGERMRNMERTRLGRDQQVMLYPQCPRLHNREMHRVPRIAWSNLTSWMLLTLLCRHAGHDTASTVVSSQAITVCVARTICRP